MNRELLNKQLTIRFIKFCIVGGSGVLVNMGCLWFFTEIVNLYYLVASILAILLAMINNFTWNDRWTWNDRGEPGIKHVLQRLVKYIFIASIAGFAGNLSLLYILTHFFNIHYMVSNLIGIAVGMTLNFLANHHWTFRG